MTRPRSRIDMYAIVFTTVILLAAQAAEAQEPVTNIWVGPLTNNATLNWLWATQYSFRAESPVNGTITGTSNDWYDAGTEISLTADPYTHYDFTEWQNIPGGTSTNNPVSFILSAAYTNVTAIFSLKRYRVTVLSDYGSPTPGSTNVTALGYSNQRIAPAFVEISPGVRVRLSGYEVQGSGARTDEP